MPEVDNPRTESPGRRMSDLDCERHKQLTNDLQSTVDKNSGRWTAMLWFLGVIGTFLGISMTILISKTSDIQTLLSKNDVILMQHTERIDMLRKDVDNIKSRNEYIDRQNSKSE